MNEHIDAQTDSSSSSLRNSGLKVCKANSPTRDRGTQKAQRVLITPTAGHLIRVTLLGVLESCEQTPHRYKSTQLHAHTAPSGPSTDESPAWWLTGVVTVAMRLLGLCLMIVRVSNREIGAAPKTRTAWSMAPPVQNKRPA
jgi:hypothetical protein